MRFTVSLHDLTPAVAAVSRFLPSKPLRPALACVRLEAEPGCLVLCATDMDNVIRVTIPAQTEAEGISAVPARYLADVLRRLPAGTVTWDGDTANNTAAITWERTRVSVAGIPPEQYPPLPAPPELRQYSFPQAHLKRGILSTSFAAAPPEAARALLTGIELRFTTKTISALATDGFHAAAFSTHADPPAADSALVVPALSLLETSRLLADTEDPVDLSIDTSHLWLHTSGADLGLRLLEGKYFSILDLVPKTFSATLSVPRTALIGACERVGVATEAHPPHAVTATIHDSQLHLYASFPGVGSAEEIMDVQLRGQDIRFAFNAQQLLAALRRFHGDQVLWELSGEDSLARISDPKDPALQYMHMPLQMTAPTPQAAGANA